MTRNNAADEVIYKDGEYQLRIRRYCGDPYDHGDGYYSRCGTPYTLSTPWQCPACKNRELDIVHAHITERLRVYESAPLSAPAGDRKPISFETALLESKGLTPAEAFMKAWNWTQPGGTPDLESVRYKHPPKYIPRIGALIEIGFNPPKEVTYRERMDFLKETFNQEGYEIGGHVSESFGGLHSSAGKSVCIELYIPPDTTKEAAAAFIEARQRIIHERWGEA